MRPVLLFVALLLAAAPSAQTASAGDAAGAPHRLPWPQPGDAPHAVELAVGGTDASVAVVVASAPSWVSFAGERAATVAGEVGEPVARLSFTVAPGAPTDAPGEVVLHVVGAGGRVLASHAVALVVAPPERLALSAPRPNPSRGAATVDVALPAAGRVRVAVHDVLGREVAVALDADREAGGHAVVLETGRLASGVYVVRAEAGGRAAAQRLTVVR